MKFSKDLDSIFDQNLLQRHKLKRRLRIRIRVKGRIRIRIKVKTRIRIRIKVMRIRNTAKTEENLCQFD